ncbi:MAG: hypothetical protein GC185_11775 [Alphaproteobacteria bacterium]|nr:hypothetical protein [Alphaproteobacteria bacterium]
MRYSSEQIVDIKCKYAEIKRRKEQEDEKERLKQFEAAAAKKDGKPANDKTPAHGKANVQTFKIQKM